MEAPPLGSKLQNMLKASVQSVQWTYSLFWQLCPQQVILVWGDGYYNGAIKTRKTVQPMEMSAEEASLQRSQQLRELYESLSAGETNPPTRRPCAALSPEDLTESEWFYLMCVSFTFSPGVGLPGKAYGRRQHIWLTGANEVDSKTFSRAILAKSARIQTVVCIPLLDGVVEFGTTEKVQEDLNFIKHVKSFFLDNHHHPPTKPALSEHSTSNPTISLDRLTYTMADTIFANTTNQDNMEEDEDEEEEDEEDEDEEAEFSSEDETGRNNKNVITPIPDASVIVATMAEQSELMQLEMSEDIRVGSPNDGSNNIDSNFHLLAMTEQDNPLGQVDSYRVEISQKWGPTQDPLNSLQVQLPASVVPQLEDHLTQEDSHYSQTVSSILQSQATRWADSSPSSIACYITCSTQSAFAKWTSCAAADHYHHATDGFSQWLLKYILFTVPYLHSNRSQEENNSTPNNINPTTATGTADRLCGSKGGNALQDELSANHVLAERRRREKLNERFIILRSLVPFVTKMDKASILGDTIEYVKQLRRKIQDLEARNHQMEGEQQQQNSRVTTIMDVNNNNNNNVQRTSSNNNSGSSTKEQSGGVVVMVGQDKRKVRILERNRKTRTMTVTPAVQVSIIESDALLELECAHREGLLLDVMMVLREMRIEVIGVQSSINNGVFVAELRAKLKENFGNGKKVSIVEVKRALYQVIPHTIDD